LKGLEISDRRTSNSHVKYADGLVLLATKEIVLQGMIDRVIEMEKYYGRK
jgi:hypothetical protein